MADGLQLAAVHFLIDHQRRQRRFLVLQRSFRVIRPFDVGAEEAGKEHIAPAGPEDRIFHFDGGRRKFQPRIGHLRGHGALPDQIVEPSLAVTERQAVDRQHLVAGRADGLVSLLCAFGFRLVVAWLFGQVFLAVQLGDTTAGRVDGLVAQVDRVGTHVGDVAVFVERLGHAHGLARAQAQLAVGFLLQRAGREGRSGRAL